VEAISGNEQEDLKSEIRVLVKRFYEIKNAVYGNELCINDSSILLVFLW
jgi:hypothetical protein